MSGEQDNVFSLGNFKHTDTDSNENNARIGHSGNSDVDIQLNVQVDTRPIAYAILCSLLATKQMTNEEFSAAVQKMDELTPYQTSAKNHKNEEPDKTDKGNGRQRSHQESNQQESNTESSNRRRPNNYPGLSFFGPMRRER
ncbi:hypothetical protein [Peribacillus glennii]|uniref:Uncharacterized protein n=1 Tax=Peribacillus glennii TaxID=2303991 RepID=A0A372LGC6_9BACI|nr:hypothetical protein [Peribacillus glennii]RFU65327.1 hypothetical protein D0466_05360 [Peribacillus glennii]